VLGFILDNKSISAWFHEEDLEPFFYKLIVAQEESTEQLWTYPTQGMPSQG
jgi:hypothetical protein